MPAPRRRVTHDEAPELLANWRASHRPLSDWVPRTASKAALSATVPAAIRGPRPPVSSSRPDPAEPRPSPSGSPSSAG
jgi:hypothetical protein